MVNIIICYVDCHVTVYILVINLVNVTWTICKRGKSHMHITIHLLVVEVVNTTWTATSFGKEFIIKLSISMATLN
jgi:hypothetical protein